MALCTDAVLRDGEVVGDPTEGAMVVLAEKGGIDVAALRRARPRLLEIPFDSDYKFMATFHRWTDEPGRDVVRCFIKGAPDVLATRADRYLAGEQISPLDDDARQRFDKANADLAEQGMRVMAVGTQDFPAQDFPAEGFDAGEDTKNLLDQVVLRFSSCPADRGSAKANRAFTFTLAGAKALHTAMPCRTPSWSPTMSVSPMTTGGL